jgi:hypothetical protein
MPEFEPMSLGRAAHLLSVEPFELVRLVASQGSPVARMEFTAARLDSLKKYAGIEKWWGDGQSPPTDSIPLRGVLRGVIGRLLEKKHIGDARTRQDNLWRGLSGKQRRFLEDAVDVLVEHGIVSVRAEATGVMLSIRAEAQDRATAISEGKDIPDDLAKLWG